LTVSAVRSLVVPLRRESGGGSTKRRLLLLCFFLSFSTPLPHPVAMIQTSLALIVLIAGSSAAPLSEKRAVLPTITKQYRDQNVYTPPVYAVTYSYAECVPAGSFGAYYGDSGRSAQACLNVCGVRLFLLASLRPPSLTCRFEHSGQERCLRHHCLWRLLHCLLVRRRARRR
jgi:hypothetical protein